MEQFLLSAFEKILKHPHGVVCKHWMLLTIIDQLERSGKNVDSLIPLIEALVQNDDEASLKCISDMQE